MSINRLGPCRAWVPSITSPYLHDFLYLHVKLTASKQGAVIVVASCQCYARVNQAAMLGTVY
ncbi:hypothetical protein BDW60DRAFT_201948 [Aspergillus nidulans var. acristatus]